MSFHRLLDALILRRAFTGARITRLRYGTLLPFLLVLGCGQGAPSSAEVSTAAGQKTIPAESPDNPRYAQRFRVQRRGKIALLEVIQPWQNAGASFRYCLIPHGQPVPEQYRDRTIIRVPARRLVAMSTTYLPAVEMLGGVDNLAGVSRFADVSSDAIQRRIEQGRMVEVGPADNVNVEVMLDLHPDLVWTYGVSEGDLANYAPLAKLDIPVVVTADYMEETPLGRAEWIKFFALFLDKEEEANKIFEGIETRYRALRAKARAATNKPKVMLESSYQGTWYVPGGRSYVAQFLADAGADYLWSADETRGSLRLDLERVLEHASQADFWLNTGRWKSVDDALAEDPRYWSFAPLRNGNIYNHNAKENASLANDFFESGPAHPDVVLADMIKIFHPELVPDHELVWYRKLSGPVTQPP
jgi:iron complex transport system substrate-binding protein